MDFQALWAAEDPSSFYAFGGQPSHPVNISSGPDTPNTLMKFRADGQEGKEWSTVPAGVNFSSFSRPAGGSSAFGAGRGFYLGGLRGDVNADCTDQCNTTTLSGMLTYDMVANEWKNVSADPFWNGAVLGGRMQYIPTFGKEGVLIALGGEPRFPTARDLGPKYPMSAVMIYDVATSRWFKQTATGAHEDQVPDQRLSFCMTGAQSNTDNSTSFELYVDLARLVSASDCPLTACRFIYGGGIKSRAAHDNAASFNTSSTDGGVWVLSLPGFVWLKANDTSASQRSDHTCEFAGGRQMISIGGIPTRPPVAQGQYLAMAQPDPFKNNIGVFDMVDLTWKDSYDAKAAPYVRPSAVASWYRER